MLSWDQVEKWKCRCVIVVDLYRFKMLDQYHVILVINSLSNAKNGDFSMQYNVLYHAQRLILLVMVNV